MFKEFWKKFKKNKKNCKMLWYLNIFKLNYIKIRLKLEKFEKFWYFKEKIKKIKLRKTKAKSKQIAK